MLVFKLTHDVGGKYITRSLSFRDTGTPAWNVIATKVEELFFIPLKDVAIAYYDELGSRIVLSSQVELEDYYASKSFCLLCASNIDHGPLRTRCTMTLYVVDLAEQRQQVQSRIRSSSNLLTAYAPVSATNSSPFEAFDFSSRIGLPLPRHVSPVPAVEKDTGHLSLQGAIGAAISSEISKTHTHAPGGFKRSIVPAAYNSLGPIETGCFSLGEPLTPPDAAKEILASSPPALHDCARGISPCLLEESQLKPTYSAPGSQITHLEEEGCGKSFRSLPLSPGPPSSFCASSPQVLSNGFISPPLIKTTRESSPGYSVPESRTTHVEEEREKLSHSPPPPPTPLSSFGVLSPRALSNRSISPPFIKPVRDYSPARSAAISVPYSPAPAPRSAPGTPCYPPSRDRSVTKERERSTPGYNYTERKVHSPIDPTMRSHSRSRSRASHDSMDTYPSVRGRSRIVSPINSATHVQAQSHNSRSSLGLPNGRKWQVAASTIEPASPNLRRETSGSPPSRFVNRTRSCSPSSFTRQPALLTALSVHLKSLASDPRLGRMGETELAALTNELLPELSTLTEAISSLARKVSLIDEKRKESESAASSSFKHG